MLLSLSCTATNNQAIKMGFNDTRCVLEPAGALAIAGTRKYVKEQGLVGHSVRALFFFFKAKIILRSSSSAYQIVSVLVLLVLVVVVIVVVVMMKVTSSVFSLFVLFLFSSLSLSRCLSRSGKRWWLFAQERTWTSTACALLASVPTLARP